MADTSVPGNIQIHLGKITKVLLLSANKTKRWQKCHYDNKQGTYNIQPGSDPLKPPLSSKEFKTDY